MSTKVAVVIPVYREELNMFEKISLAQVREVLGHYPIVFVAPEGKTFSYFTPSDMVAYFPPQCFQSVKTYNQLLMTPLFYEPFLDFDYILIYQLDAFVFYDALEDFCSLGYAYIGAPWPYLLKMDGIFLRVGNGGFSLRRVKAHYNLLRKHADWVEKYKTFNEDMFLSFCGTKDADNFRVAPVNVAYKFSMELNPDRCIKKNGGNLPFGCHAWCTRVENFYVKTFLSVLLDEQTVKKLLRDAQTGLITWLHSLAMDRFKRRLQNGRPLLRYLPTKHFASVRVVRSFVASKILSQLLSEEDFRADDVIVCDSSEQTELLRGMECEEFPHLIISAEDDTPLMTAVANRGLRHGEHVISFQREYMKRCKELFRELGTR